MNKRYYLIILVMCSTHAIWSTYNNDTNNNPTFSEQYDDNPTQRLAYAIVRGDIDAYNQAKNDGAQLNNNLPLFGGDTPLHLTMRWIRPAMFFDLLHQRVAVDSKNDAGFTPLHLGLYKTLQEQTPVSPLGKMVTFLILASFVLQKQANNMLDPDGNTPLHYVAACQKGYPYFFLLYSCGGYESINIKNKDNNTPLGLIASYDIELATYIIRTMPYVDPDLNIAHYLTKLPSTPEKQAISYDMAIKIVTEAITMIETMVEFHDQYSIEDKEAFMHAINEIIDAHFTLLWSFIDKQPFVYQQLEKISKKDETLPFIKDLITKKILGLKHMQ